MPPFLPWIFVTALFFPVFHQLIRSGWAAVDYSHAYFVLPLSAWLAWRRRDELKNLAKPVQPPFGYLGLLLLGLALFLFGWRQSYLSVTTASLIPILTGLSGWLYGSRAVGLLSFPIAYLALLIPPPLGLLDGITLPMRYGVSVAAASILEIFGYPVSRQGLLLSIGSHQLYMGQPCSGFRSLISLLSLGLVYVHLLRGSFWKKAILVGTIVPFALLGNLVRILALCLITFYFGEAAGQGFFHNFSGFVVFLIMIASMSALELVLSSHER